MASLRALIKREIYEHIGNIWKNVRTCSYLISLRILDKIFEIYLKNKCIYIFLLRRCTRHACGPLSQLNGLGVDKISWYEVVFVILCPDIYIEGIGCPAS